MTQFYSYLALTTLEFTFIKPTCTFRTNNSFPIIFYGTLITVFALVVITVLLLWTLAGIRYVFARRKGHHVAIQVLNWYKKRFPRAMCILVNFLYLNIASLTIGALHCVEVTGELRVLADKSVACYVGEHVTIAAISWLLVIVVLVGAPIGMILIVFHVRGQFRHSAVQPRWGFLYESFHLSHMSTATFLIWNLVISLVLVICSAVLPPYPEAQLSMMLILFFAYLYLLAKLRPYTDPMDTVIDVFSTIIGIVAAILAYLSSDSVAESDLNTTMQDVLSYSVMGTLAV